MNKQFKVTKHVLSILLCVAMMLTSVPMQMMPLSAASANSTYARTADPHTLDQWKNYFGVQTNHAQNLELSTEYAGGGMDR